MCVYLSLSHVQLFMTPWTITPRLLCLWNSPDERILEWVAIPFSRESSQRRTETLVFCPAADSLPSEPPEKPHLKSNMSYSYRIPYHILPFYREEKRGEQSVHNHTVTKKQSQCVNSGHPASEFLLFITRCCLGG